MTATHPPRRSTADGPTGHRPAPAGQRPAGSVAATARMTAAPDGRGGTALVRLSGGGPLVPRRTHSADPGWARVTLLGAMSVPLGGDRIAIEAEATDGARLWVGSTAATLALPGQSGASAEFATRLTVGERAELHWSPEPLISAAGSDLRQSLHAELAPGARLVLRDQQVLGRSGEPPGRLTTRLTVRRAGSVLVEQELSYGPGVPGWDGGAVLAGYRSTGQLLVVDPEFERRPAEARVLEYGGVAALTPLAGPAALVTAVAEDGGQVRRLLDTLGDELLAAPAGQAP